MRNMIILTISGVLLVTGGLALADGNNSNGNPDPNEIICHPGKPDIGSRIPSAPECHTRAQWQQMQRDAQKDLDRMQHVAPLTGGGG